VLFWDEPESNLNPRLIKTIASVLMDLSQHGVQVIIATHSLFLLREIELLSQLRKIETRYVGLELQTEEDVVAHVADSLDNIPTIVALEEELSQNDRYLGLDKESPA